VHNPKSALLFAGPVLGIDPGVVTVLLVTAATVVEVVEVEVEDVLEVDVESADAVRPNAWACAVEDA
jgi:hypothetical protein